MLVQSEAEDRLKKFKVKGWESAKIAAMGQLPKPLCEIGRFLLDHAEAAAPPSVTTYSVLVGAGKQDALAFYEDAGYTSRGKLADRPGVLLLTKPRSG